MIKKSKFIEKNFGPTLIYFFMQNKIIQNLCIALGTIKALFPKFGPNFSQTQTDRHELIEPFHKAGVQKVMFFKICGFKKRRYRIISSSIVGQQQNSFALNLIQWRWSQEVAKKV